MVLKQRHCAREASRRAFDLIGETTHQKSNRGKQLKVGELFHLEVSDVATCFVDAGCLILPPDREPSPARSSHDGKREIKSISGRPRGRTRCESGTARGPVDVYLPGLWGQCRDAPSMP